MYVYVYIHLGEHIYRFTMSDKTICDDEVISPQMIPQMRSIPPTTVVRNRIHTHTPNPPALGVC